MARFCNIGVLLLLITLFITTQLSATAGAECRGGGTVGDCMETGGEEFLMDSETTRRLLAGEKKPLSYVLLQKPQPCKADRYGSCLQDAVGVKMNCNNYNKSCVKP
nr:rapid alkalinization factor-like [Ipomoea batatas]